MAAERTTALSGLFNFIRRLTAGWALVGGVLIIALVLVNTWSLISGFVMRRPVPGDFEITQVATAVAVFTFLPYCQITGANVTADIFTERAGPRLKAVLAALGSFLALLFATVLGWRTYEGLLDLVKYRETTAIYQFPHWIAYVPIVISLALLILAALVTLITAVTMSGPEEEEALF